MGLNLSFLKLDMGTRPPTRSNGPLSKSEQAILHIIDEQYKIHSLCSTFRRSFPDGAALKVARLNKHLLRSEIPKVVKEELSQKIAQMLRWHKNAALNCIDEGYWW